MIDDETREVIEESVKSAIEQNRPSFEYVYRSIRLTEADVDLLQFCPLIALLGVVAVFIMKQKFPTRFSTWALGTLRGSILGIVAGLLVAIFFLGMATNDTWSTPRILLLSFFMGANAKTVWESALSLSRSFISEGHKLIAKRGGVEADG